MQELLRKRGDMNLGTSISRRHLQALDLSELEEICYDLGLPAVDVNVPDKAHTKVQQLLMAMLGSCFGPHAQPPGPRLRYEELQTHMLKQLCEAQGLPSTGKRPKLLELLVVSRADIHVPAVQPTALVPACFRHNQAESSLQHGTRLTEQQLPRTSPAACALDCLCTDCNVDSGSETIPYPLDIKVSV